MFPNDRAPADAELTGDCSGELLAGPANGAWLGGRLLRTPPRPPKPVDVEDLFVPLPSGKLDADAKQAMLTLICAVGCTGTASACRARTGRFGSTAGGT